MTKDPDPEPDGSVKIGHFTQKSRVMALFDWITKDAYSVYFCLNPEAKKSQMRIQFHIRNIVIYTNTYRIKFNTNELTGSPFYIANTMFRVLENPALALQRTKDVR
jgi:hypothetical protein